ncbi:hypothetical protein GOODEAATRI_027829 [Goodea atripinnis]|uniref:Uncharacterized protein n=1 Tax=Goodea atripinnis TaxID=208336 RepID=A0ABV0NE80_9TELE
MDIYEYVILASPLRVIHHGSSASPSAPSILFCHNSPLHILLHYNLHLHFFCHLSLFISFVSTFDIICLISQQSLPCTSKRSQTLFPQLFTQTELSLLCSHFYVCIF